MNGLFEELKHRNVFRVGVAYLALAWLIIQITSIAVPALNLPEALNSIVFYLGLIGFPFALLFAWAFELTPDGLKRSADVADDMSIRSDTGRKLNYVVIGMLVFIAGLTLWQGQLAPQKHTGANDSEASRNPAVISSKKQVVNDSTGGYTRPSIAVLAFKDFSPGNDQEYFGDGIAEEILNLLVKTNSMTVIGRTSSFSFKNKEVDLPTIAKALSVENILEGSISKSGNKLKITVQLNNAQGIHLWSETYKRDFADIFAIQEEVAGSILEALQLHLGVARPSRGLPTTNMEAYQLFLEAKTSTYTFFDKASALEKAVKLDPGFVEAHEQLAWQYKSIIGAGAGVAKEYQPRVIKHVNIVLSLDPKRVGIKPLLLPVISVSEELMEALDATITAQPHNNSARAARLYYLMALGYFEEALMDVDAAIVQDPLYNIYYIQRAAALNALGRKKEATSSYLFWGKSSKTFTILNRLAITAMLDGNVSSARGFVSDYTTKTGQDSDAVFAFLERLIEPATRADAFDEPVRLVYLGLDSNGQSKILMLAQFKDARFWQEFEKRSITGNSLVYMFAEMMRTKPAWILNDSRFKVAAKEFGAIDYWRNNKLPDFCHGSFKSWICELHDER